jgi:hypothetical protein
MITFEHTTIQGIVLHQVSTQAASCFINEQPLPQPTDFEADLLKKILLKPFLTLTQTFEFKHDVALEYNVLYGLVGDIQTGANLIATSKSIVQHLIGSSKHPNIKDGEVFIVKFDNLILANQAYSAVGIYKFEEKESFIDTSFENGAIKVNFRKGLSSKKPDKACLVVFNERPFTILVIDSQAKETEYWQQEFINLKPKNDNVNSTNAFLTITKDFITKQIPEAFQITKADQIDFLNRSVDYFKNHETFDKHEFEDEVFADKKIISKFQEFDENYRLENEIELLDSFEISAQAVKKQARVFKSVLKLDKNFHIYIHGNRDLIEQGVDEKGRKYYKIYYQEEA